MELSVLADAVLGRIFVELEASARHVHITKSQALTLFGHDLTEDRPLSQPGQYLARERVQIIGPKGEFCNVAVLGPARGEAQVELSMTDARHLGLQPPVRPSGSVEDSPGVVLKGETGSVELEQGVIIAQRHLHLKPETAARFGVKDKQTVSLQTFTDRPVLFQDVLVRVSQSFADRGHLDLDEANACGLKKGDLGRIIL